MTNISNKEELRKLIAKYVQGKATTEEVAFLKSYYDHFDDKNDGLSDRTEHQKNRLKSQLFNEIQSRIHSTRPQTGMIFRFSRIAAAVLVLIAAAVGYWYFSQTEAVLETITVENQDNLLVVDSAIAQEKHIYLPDGSYVVLEPGSRLEYSREFSKSERVVELDGQAYFDIQHDSLRPFLVHTNEVTTRVLGTAFSISSIDKNKEFTISVTRGKVEVSDETHQLGILHKDDQLILDLVSGEVTKNKMGEEQTTTVEPAVFIMDDMSVAEAIEIVSKRWDCTFDIKDPALKNCRFTTSFVPTDGLGEVVAVIALVIGAEYQIENKVVSLSGDGCD